MAKRKRTRTAAQKANDAKLRSRAKAGTLFKKRKTAHKAPKRRKTIKRTKSKSHVAKKRTSHKKSGLLGKIPLISNPTFKKAAAGVGTATIGAAVLSLVAPSIAAQPLVKPLLALAGGDIVGLAAQVFTQGGLSSLGIGSSSNGSSAASTNGNGFA